MVSEVGQSSVPKISAGELFEVDMQLFPSVTMY